RRRAPRSAAVAIRGVVDGFSYADAMRMAKERILLKDLGINNTRIKRAMGGALLIEVLGPEGNERAQKLKEELSRVLGESAVVSRPVVRGDIRVVGVDVSVTPEEVAAAVAEAGRCAVEDAVTSPMRPMRNGLFMTWVRLPLAAAIKASSYRRLSIGWTAARVELLDARPIQCFKCWSFGHVQSRCESEVDRRDMCLRCGEAGHKLKQCSAQFKCVLCAAEGRSAQHRIGVANC
ncbi:hypothetical protein EAG_11697, partial [Camponotus floridanus]